MDKGWRIRRSWSLLAGITLWTASAAAQSASDPRALWAALTQPGFDPEQVAIVENVTLQRDAATVTLTSGRLALSLRLPAAGDREGRVFAAFRGTGRLRLAPSLPLEKQQLTSYSGQPILDAEFSEAVFLFTDNTLEELRQQLKFQPGPATDLEALYRERNARWTRNGFNWEPRLLKSLLAEHPERHALFVAELKTREHNWLTLVMDEADPEQVELFQFDSAQNWQNIWTKFPKQGRRPSEAFADPLAHYDYNIDAYTLAATIPPSTDLEAEAVLGLTQWVSGERVLLLSLDPNLRVTELTDGGGQPLAFFQPDDPKDRAFWGDYLVVVAPEPFPEGPNTLRFRYGGKRIIRKVGADNYFCQSFGWYPTYGMGRVSLDTNEFAARANFDLTLRVPKKHVAVAVGRKIEEHEEGDFRVTRWQSEIPLAVAGFAFGDYKVVTETVGQTQVEVYVNKTPDDFFRSLASFDTPTTAFGPEMAEAMLALRSVNPVSKGPEMAEEVANSLRVMEHYFGPYPYSKLAVSNIPYSYGQGWPSLLYISVLSFFDSFQRNILFDTDQVRLTDFFRAHETSHQWWGHAVGWKSYHDQWLSEGFAEFSGILYILHRRKPDEYLRLLRSSRELLQRQDPADRRNTVFEQIGPIYAGARLSSAQNPGGYSVVVYRKGGWVLHMLRMMLFDPTNAQNPDARFITLMQDFTKTYFNQSASTEDFKFIVQKHMLPHMDLENNGTMDWFFDSWVYGTGIPQYELTVRTEPAAGGQYKVRGTLRQSGVPETFRTILPLYVRQGKRFSRVGWLRVLGSETTFEFPLGFKPDKITINEWEDVLCTVNYKK